MNERQNLMCEIQRMSFALVETVLFLDGHPHDEKALKYYCETKEKYEEILGKYEECYGPISLSGVKAEKSWSWVETPWPWEMEAN